MSHVVLGLDIGGANLKAATPDGRAAGVPFPLWKQPEKLTAALGELVKRFEPVAAFAVTMTGELCDCFATKRDGVNHILDAVEAVAGDTPVRVWGTDGALRSVAEARADTLTVAASNWHALATFAGRFAPSGPGLLIDIGSTTTDIIPLRDGVPVPVGHTDFDRLRSGELVYVGVKRTPVMALGLPGVCAEYFADTRDVHIVLGQMPEEPDATDTADNRPATRTHSLARLARMFGADTDTATVEEIVAFARECFNAQRGTIRAAVLRQFPPGLQAVVVSGAGEWLAREVAPMPVPQVVRLSEALGADVSACAPAYAVAVLATEARP